MTPERAKPTGERRARRKARRSRRRPRGPNRPAVGRVILGSMVALTLVDLVFTLYKVRCGSSFYGDVIIGSTRREARYLKGTPARVVLLSNTASPALDAAALDSGDHGRLRSVSWSDPKLGSFGCPPALGIMLGIFEDEIWYRLGASDHESYKGDTENISYDVLRLTFALRKFEVVAIKLSDNGATRPICHGSFAYCFLEPSRHVDRRVRAKCRGTTRTASGRRGRGLARPATLRSSSLPS